MTAAYPLGGVVIVFLAVLVVRETTGADQRSLGCLLGGLLAITLSDWIFGPV